MLSARCQPFCSDLNVIMALPLDQCQQDAACLLLPVTHLTNDLWHHRWRFFFAVIFILMMQPGHEFAHVTTALLSWHVQNHDMIRSLFFTKSNTIFSKIWIMSLLIVCDMGPWIMQIPPDNPVTIYPHAILMGLRAVWHWSMISYGICSC